MWFWFWVLWGSSGRSLTRSDRKVSLFTRITLVESRLEWRVERRDSIQDLISKREAGGSWFRPGMKHVVVEGSHMMAIYVEITHTFWESISRYGSKQTKRWLQNLGEFHKSLSHMGLSKGLHEKWHEKQQKQCLTHKNSNCHLTLLLSWLLLSLNLRKAKSESRSI